jgi:hypothetical protein
VLCEGAMASSSKISIAMVAVAAIIGNTLAPLSIVLYSFTLRTHTRSATNGFSIVNLVLFRDFCVDSLLHVLLYFPPLRLESHARPR